MKTMMAPDRSFGAVVFRVPDGSPDREYLLVHHASGNHWDHPKGHPENSETPRETATREIFEETGVNVRFLEGFQTEAGWTLPSGREKIVLYFLAERVISEGRENERAGGPEGEILDTVWLSFDSALKRISYETGRKVLKKAEDFLSKH